MIQLVEEFETDATKPDSLKLASNKVSNYQKNFRLKFHFLLARWKEKEERFGCDCVRVQFQWNGLETGEGEGGGNDL